MAVEVQARFEALDVDARLDFQRFVRVPIIST